MTNADCNGDAGGDDDVDDHDDDVDDEDDDDHGAFDDDDSDDDGGQGGGLNQALPYAGLHELSSALHRRCLAQVSVQCKEVLCTSRPLEQPSKR